MVTEFITSNLLWWIVFVVLIVIHIVLSKNKKDFSFYDPTYFTYVMIVVVIGFCAVNVISTIESFDRLPRTQAYINFGICGFIFIELLLSIVQINANEIGIKLLFGAPGAKVGPGLHLMLFPFYSLSRYPADEQEIYFATSPITTVKGMVEGKYKEVYDSIDVILPIKLYYAFDINNLDKTVVNAPGKTEEELSSPLIAAVSNAFRNYVSRVPWGLINNESYGLIQMVLSQLVPFNSSMRSYTIEVTESPNGAFNVYSLKQLTSNFNRMNYPSLQELEKNSPFVKYGLKNVHMKIYAVQGIEEVDTARNRASALKFSSRAEKYKRIKEGEGSAITKRNDFEVSRGNEDLEAMATLRAMTQGKSNTILFQLPTALGNKMRELLANDRLDEFPKVFSPDQQKYIKDTIKRYSKIK